MASGSSSGRNNSGSKGFDFAADDILCSYEDYANQDSNSNGTHSDPPIANKEFHKSRMAKSSAFPASSYSPPEESLNQDVITTVERTMKKYADNLMRFLEGISSRLSQLELYCYNLDKSIGEMRSELARDNGEADSKLKFLEKHLQEVHRSVQILRDKQELAEAQKELAKIQLSQRDSKQNEERASTHASDPKKNDSTPGLHGQQQLALALPNQILQQPSLPTRPVEHHHHQQPVAPQPSMLPQGMTPSQGYYLSSAQLSNLPSQMQPSHGQYIPSDSPYRTSSQPTQSQVNLPPQNHPVPQYQQQWAQQGQQPQHTSVQAQIRPPSPNVYPPYMSNQAANPSPQETLPSSMPMQMAFSGISQPVPSRPETMPYGYSGVSRPVQPQPPPQHMKSTFGAQPGEGYPASGPGPTTYTMHDSEGGRAHNLLPQQPLFHQSGGYAQNQQPTASNNPMARPSQFVRSHPYNELVEKLVSMGYRGDHVVSAIQRLEESGQPVDFNAVLDRLNGHSSGVSQRGWSG